MRAVASGATTWPATVIAMAQSRLEALSMVDRQLLRAASVVGEVFWAAVVEAMTGHADAPARLEALVAQEVLVARSHSRLEGQRELAFRHALLRDAAEAMLTDEDRARGHRLAGEWLRDHHAALAPVLARHFELGLRPTEAAEWWSTAATEALAANDFDGALQAAQRGHANAPTAAQAGPRQIDCVDLAR